MSKPTLVMRASNGEVLVMVKVKLLVASLNETLTVPVDWLPVLLPVMGAISLKRMGQGAHLLTRPRTLVNRPTTARASASPQSEVMAK